MSIYTVITPPPPTLLLNYSIPRIPRTVPKIWLCKLHKYTKYTAGHCKYFLSVKSSSVSLHSAVCEAQCALLKSVSFVKLYAVCMLVYLQFVQRGPFIVSLGKAALSLRELATARISRDSRHVQGTIRVTRCTMVSVGSSDWAIFSGHWMSTEVNRRGLTWGIISTSLGEAEENYEKSQAH